MGKAKCSVCKVMFCLLGKWRSQQVSWNRKDAEAASQGVHYWNEETKISPTYLGVNALKSESHREVIMLLEELL